MRIPQHGWRMRTRRPPSMHVSNEHVGPCLAWIEIIRNAKNLPSVVAIAVDTGRVVGALVVVVAVAIVAVTTTVDVVSVISLLQQRR